MNTCPRAGGNCAEHQRGVLSFAASARVALLETSLAAFSAWGSFPPLLLSVLYQQCAGAFGKTTLLSLDCRQRFQQRRHARIEHCIVSHYLMGRRRKLSSFLAVTADGCRTAVTLPGTWLPSARLARTNWSRDPNKRLDPMALLGLHVNRAVSKANHASTLRKLPVQRAFFQVGKFINLRIGPARDRIE